MRGNFGCTFLLMLASGLTAFAQQPAVQSQSSPANPPGPHAERPPAGHQTGSNEQSPLTNADVIKMVKGGVPESTIISSIQSSPTKFDLSVAALTGLRKAGVSEKIIEAMRAAGNTEQGAQSTPKKTIKPTPEQMKAALAKLKSKPGHLSPMISNTQVSQAEAETVATLQRQKQAVQSGQVLSATGNPGGGQSTPPGAPGGQNPAGGSSNPTGGSSNPPGGSNPNNPNPNNPSGGQNPVGGLPSKPGASTARAVAMAPTTIPAPQSSGSSLANVSTLRQTNIDACNLPNMPPGIKGLNSQGYYGPAVFSQDPKYNPFWIIGCHFGTASGRVYINATSGQKLADLTVDSWTDTLIKATIDPSLIDIFDQDNVTLVVVAANGQQGQKSGFKFFAMRKEILLRDIPKSQVSLASITDTGGLGVVGYYSSPYQGLGYSVAVQTDQTTTPNHIEAMNLEMQNSDQGMTAGVDRNAWYRFGGGTDVYDFSKLKPGFGVSRFQIDERTMPICHEGVTAYPVVPQETDYNDGSWNAQFYLAESKIRVTFAEEHCHISDNGSDSSNSTYALNVWVIGPVMRPQADPWQPGLK